MYQIFCANISTRMVLTTCDIATPPPPFVTCVDVLNLVPILVVLLNLCLVGLHSEPSDQLPQHDGGHEDGGGENHAEDPLSKFI